MDRFMSLLLGILLIVLAAILFGFTARYCWGAERYSNAPMGKRSEPGERMAPIAPNKIMTPDGVVYDNAEMKRFFQRGRDPFRAPRGER